MASQSALEIQTGGHAQPGDDRQIGPVEPMRLVFGKEARAKPVDRVQYRVPGKNIADPIRHHSRHVENSRAEVQYAGQLRPNLIPRLEKGVDDRIDEAG